MQLQLDSLAHRVLAICIGAAMAAPTSLLAPSTAQASPSAEASADARALYEQGRTAFDAGRFDEAASLFDQAYEKAENPNLRYNAAIAYEEAGNLDTAYKRLEECRAESPATEHASLDAELVRVEKAIEARDAGDSSDGEAPPPEARTSEPSSTPERDSDPGSQDDTRPKRARAGLIVTGVLAGTAGVVALGFGLAALQRKGAVEDECAMPEDGGAQPICLRGARGLERDRKTFAVVTDASIGVAAASAIVFTVLLITSRKKRKNTARAAVGPILSADTAGAAISGRF